MLDYNTFIVHEFDEPIKIIPLGDTHAFSIYANMREFEKVIETIKNTPDLYVVLTGDIINNNTRSSVGSPWEDTANPAEQKREVAEMLRPIKDKILCAVCGNHEARSVKDAFDDPMYDIMSKLDIENRYRADGAIMIVRIGKKSKGHGVDGAITSYAFAITHGSGGGKRTGSSVNNIEDFARNFENIDCVICGHTHKGSVTRIDKIRINSCNKHIINAPVLCVVSVPWQKYGGYALRKMLPTSQSCVPQVLYLNKDRKYIETTW